MNDEAVSAARFRLSNGVWRDVETVWSFHHMKHDIRSCDAAIVLGCHDIGVADVAAEAWVRGLAPVFVVTGATSAATQNRFPSGEAVAFAARMRAAGVPAEAVLVEPAATNTGANIAFSRRLLHQHGVVPSAILLVSMPYMERRAYATCQAAWPGPDPVCLSSSVSLAGYLSLMANRDGMDVRLVVDMVVGDLQRVIEYPSRGFQVPQEVPEEVHAAYKRLIACGFDSKLTE